MPLDIYLPLFFWIQAATWRAHCIVGERQHACNQSKATDKTLLRTTAMNDARLRGDQMEDRARAEHQMQRRITTREYAERE
jgi:hypothetical protein